MFLLAGCLVSNIEHPSVERVSEMEKLRDKLQEKIIAAIPNAIAVGAQSARLPHTLSIAHADNK